MDAGADIALAGGTNPFDPTNANNLPWKPPPKIKIYLRHGNLGAQKAASPFEYRNLMTANNLARTHF